MPSIVEAQLDADGLMAAGRYDEAAMEYERQVFRAADPVSVSVALRRKADCLSLMHRYGDAADVLLRVADRDSCAEMLAFNQYMADRYDETVATCDEQRLLHDTLTQGLLLLRVLALNELARYDEARADAVLLARTIDRQYGGTASAWVDSLYAHVPHLKSEKTSQWLSIVPGLGHVYAGYPLEGISAFVINVAALGFGVWQVFERCYITAYVGGAGLLASTYPGLFGSAAHHARKTNHKRMTLFNEQCRNGLTDRPGKTLK